MLIRTIHYQRLIAWVACIFGFSFQAQSGSLTLTYEIRVSGGTAFDVAAADPVESPLGGMVQFKVECPQSTPAYSSTVRLANVTARAVAFTTVVGVPENTPCTVTETGYKVVPISAPGGYRSPSVEPYQRAFLLGSAGLRTEAFLALWSPPVSDQIRGNILRGPDTGTLNSIAGPMTGMSNDFRLTIFNSGGFVVFEDPNDPLNFSGFFRNGNGAFAKTGILPDGVYTAVLGGGYPKNTSGIGTCFCISNVNFSEFTSPPEQRSGDPNVIAQSLRANWISTGETASATQVSDGIPNGIITNFEIRNGQPSGPLLFSLRPAAAAASDPLAVPTLSAEMLGVLFFLVTLVAGRRSLRTRKVRS